MINFPKTQPAPKTLAIEKQKEINSVKKSGSYKEQDVQEQLSRDFKGKCYLCEDDAGQNLQVEHLKAHKNVDINKKFDWNNLLHCCGFCNSVKNQHKDDILDCTDLSTLIAEVIAFNYLETDDALKISAVQNEQSVPNSVSNTVELLNQIHQGSEKTKCKAEALRCKIIKALGSLKKKIDRYYDTEKPIDRDDVGDELQRESPFLAFKIWYIKSKPAWEADFKPYFDPTVHR